MKKTLEILNSMKKTTCNVYLCKIHFFMAFIGVLLRTWTQILRKSLFNGSFLQLWKKAVIRLLIKSCELYRELKNYQPVSNLLFISKCIAKAFLLQLSTFLCRSKPIMYLPECLVQTPLNRNSGIQSM